MPRTPSPIPSGSATDEVILAADVGGTHARVGLLRAAPGRRPPVELFASRTYNGAEWPEFAGVLEDFVNRQGRSRSHIARCALAVTGYLRDDAIVAENLPWPIRLSTLRARLGLNRLDVVNDFEALASATRFLAPAEGVAIMRATGTPGPTLVLGPGTGMGCAVLLPSGDSSLVMPSEAGHAALAPGTPREMEVLRVLARGRAYVHVGYALSGPGLLNLYRAVVELDQVAAAYSDPKQVSAAALRGDDLQAREALAMFCALLGSFAGDLAITFRASAGVVLAGGILPHIQEFLLASDFSARFLNKGVMREFLNGVPVKLIEHGQLGVIGAAAMQVPAARA